MSTAYYKIQRFLYVNVSFRNRCKPNPKGGGVVLEGIATKHKGKSVKAWLPRSGTNPWTGYFGGIVSSSKQGEGLKVSSLYHAKSTLFSKADLDRAWAGRKPSSLVFYSNELRRIHLLILHPTHLLSLRSKVVWGVMNSLKTVVFRGEIKFLARFWIRL